MSRSYRRAFNTDNGSRHKFSKRHTNVRTRRNIVNCETSEECLSVHKLCRGQLEYDVRDYAVPIGYDYKRLPVIIHCKYMWKLKDDKLIRIDLPKKEWVIYEYNALLDSKDLLCYYKRSNKLRHMVYRIEDTKWWHYLIK